MRRRRLLQVCMTCFALAAGRLAAQTARKSARVGILVAATPAAADPLLAVFVTAMRELGWEEGRNVEYIRRYANSDSARFGPVAAELAAKNVDVIFTEFGDAAKAAAQAAPNLPIVFALSADPVASGIEARFPQLARELVDLKVDLICVVGGSAAFAAKAATSTIPIVFVAAPNPVSISSCQAWRGPAAT